MYKRFIALSILMFFLLLYPAMSFCEYGYNLKGGKYSGSMKIALEKSMVLEVLILSDKLLSEPLVLSARRNFVCMPQKNCVQLTIPRD